MCACMETGKKIQILLSTYNGEKYLREQLDSYYAQTCCAQICVLIRDDGSTDGTEEILREYAQRDAFRVVFGENLGVNGSYQWLIEHSDPQCDYYALSDQDDVWYPEKLNTALAVLDEADPGIPCLFASCTQITDANLRPIGTSTLPVRGISFYNAMIQNILPGHTQVMNQRMMTLSREMGFAQVHVIDWWFYLVASGVGRVLYHPQCTVLHRQHGGNAVGMRVHTLSHIFRRLRFIREKRGNACSLQLQAFFCQYGAILPAEMRNETEHFFSHMSSFHMRVRYVLHCKAYRQERFDTLIFKILYILGKYNC